MKVVIAGFGIEGQASLNYWHNQGAEVSIADERDSLAVPVEATRALLGADAFSDLGEYDLIVRSPSLSPSKLPYGDKVWSATNEFFAQCPAPIVGVTGTKGKGTTCSLIASILRAAGKTVHVVGNIGVPALTVLPQITADDVVVYELSSFQLWDAQCSPRVAVVLMIEPDHLDVHADMDDYVAAKSRIVMNQGPDDLALYHPTNELSAQIAHSGESFTAKYATKEDGQVYVDSNTFFVQDTPICSVDALHIAGVHNQENACAAISAALAMGVATTDVEAGLSAFDGLPHRLKLVRTVSGVMYYDDSIATTPGSAIAALRAFSQPKVIILGGSDKGITYDEIVAECKAVGATVIAIGQTGAQIAQLCQQMDVPYHRLEGLMDEVVVKAHEVAVDGGVVILSPASASFDQYTSYSHRGDAFIAAVEAL